MAECDNTHFIQLILSVCYVASIVLSKRVASIVTWQGRYHDQEGGFPSARLIHCTLVVLTLVISPNVGNSHNLW